MEICLNCNAELAGEFCTNCGQKRLERKDRSLWSFTVHFFNEFFNWDSKFWSSFVPVLTKPGYLTEEYNNGKIKRHISPLKIYLCISLVVFLIGRNTDSDTLGQLTEGEDDDIFTSYIESSVASKGISYENFSEKFDKEAYDKLPVYTLIMVFLFSLPVWALFGTHKRFYVEHLVFSLHFYCFVLVSVTIGDLFSLMDDVLLYPFIFLIPAVFMLLALKRVYKESTIATGVKWSFLVAFYFLLWAGWFFSVFFITIWTI